MSIEFSRDPLHGFSFATRTATLVAMIGLALALAGAASADSCVVTDNGSGTVTLPPAGCEYLSPTDVHMIVDGLPAGTTIELAPIHKDFICGGAGTPLNCSLPIPPGTCEAPGGSQGGNGDCFNSNGDFQLTGTGTLSGFSRTVSLPLEVEVHTGPRTPGTSVQSFDTEMFALQGQITGDPDFDLLRVTAGQSFGMPSPGHTTLTRLPGNEYNVDSFFDITYRIDFVGAPGGPLSGMSGSTTATIRMASGEPPPNPCVVADNGSGTVTLPPAGCDYLSPDEVHMIIAGLPPGTTIELDPIHKNFICGGPVQVQCSLAIPPGQCEGPGGVLAGNGDCFGSDGEFQLTGTGILEGYSRPIILPLETEIHTGPRTPGSSVQSFETQMMALQGQITGDPDFDLLRITAGQSFGMPSPGHTTLTRQGGAGAPYNVDSFFDITYRIDFVGRPGGPLGGMSGSTTGTIRMATGLPEPGALASLAAGVMALLGLQRWRQRRGIA